MTAIRTLTFRSLSVLGCVALLCGCLGGSGESASGSQNNTSTGAPANGGSASNGTAAPNPQDGASAANRLPSVAGTPPTTATIDEAYRFQPEAADPDGDALTFRITNKPAWATFDETSGELSGTPEAGDAGTYEGVRIAVTDGTGTTSLNAFDITVLAQATGQVTLSWTAPTQNADGTALTNLAGYKVYYGRSAGALSTVRKLDVGVTSVVIENLSSGTWFFAMSSFNTADIESARTATISKNI